LTGASEPYQITAVPLSFSLLHGIFMTAQQNLEVDASPANVEEDHSRLCGIVMPIAAMGDYTEAHWLDVQGIIKESVASAGYEARLVSESPDATVIIRSIVQNVYKDEIVICDVSGMNPNVMFELGMRLAFDKPVVIIKDEVTRFSFDISTIEHLVYPRSLRYQSIQDFKKKLAEKIRATAQASKQEGHSSFLTNFGSFTVANLQETTLNESEALERILTKLDKFDSRLVSLESFQDKDYLNRKIPIPAPRTVYRVVLQRKVGKSSFNSNREKMLLELVNNIFGDDVRVIVVADDEANIVNVAFTSILERTTALLGKLNSLFNSVFEIKE